ncbi:hypothetical protein QYE76_065631 [Lolium multiflorum]|uniref:F-box domain-containing protein n=1 Tax=Lolium multiflorum TaxID=4521 RepID=A0AAD8S8V7_LOLMU|nr:hypothetical protein QYE76_065631 [Lolium multiflorum]
MEQRRLRHRIFVVPLPLHSPPPSAAGEHRATVVALEREEATAARRARPKRIRSYSYTAGMGLPDEIVVWQIFLRLPSKAILRCRAVCRSWRGITSAPDFLLAHHRRQPSLPLVALDATDSGLSLSDATAKCNPPILGFDDYDGWKLAASCDGLLLVSLSNARFSICNPATRQCAPLPGLTTVRHIHIAGLYPHGSSGDYRVLYWKRPEYYILSMQQRHSSRRIGVPTASPEMQMVMREEEGLISKRRDPPIMLRNCLHWKPAHYDDPNYAAGIVVFDTVAELFRLMPGPAAAATTASRRTSLHDMDGSIGLGCFDEESATAKIWVLEDYEKEGWSFKYQIQLPVWNMPHHAYVQRVVLPHSRNMLVCRYSNFFIVACSIMTPTAIC